MIYNYLLRLSVFLFSLISFSVFAQEGKPKLNDADKLKLEGKITGKENNYNTSITPADLRISNFTPQLISSGPCDNFIPVDTSFQVAPFGGPFCTASAPDYRNDDCATPFIVLPFQFCFYGQMVDTIYVNNNGNISIRNPYTTFSGVSFPDTFVMIAPFWADVDTRAPGSGLVYIRTTPTHVTVIWDHVGYFPIMDDKLNTFQLTITDGIDPILPPGSNVSFSYQDMQWTTGSASQGVNGFGGIPATVGVNLGNGINFFQFGRFDSMGTHYDGPFNNPDGVDWLDGQTFNLNVCTNSGATNIPPVLSSLNVCDTIRLCQNTTYQLTANYLSPEAAELTHINFFAGSMTGVTVLSNTPGNTATLVIEIVGQTSNLGFHTISVTAIDDGTPSAATNNNFVIEVLPAPLPSFTFLPASPVMTNIPVAFTNTTPPGNLFTWDFGDASPVSHLINPPHTYTTSGLYTVTLTSTLPNGCSTSVTQQIDVLPCAPATITVVDACVNTPALITYTSFSTPTTVFTWDFDGGTIISGSGAGPYNVSWPSVGTYSISLTVTENTCTSTVTMPVDIYAGPVSSITSIPSLCAGDSHTISFNGTANPGSTFVWNFGSATVLSGSGAGPYSLQWFTAGLQQVQLSVDDNGCIAQSFIDVTVNAIPTSSFIINNAACIGSPVSLAYNGTANSSANYTWTFNNGTVVTGTGAGPYSVIWNSQGQFTVSLIVNENGCISPQTDLQATINPLPFVFAGIDLAICSGAPASIGKPPVIGEIYSWTPVVNISDPTISDPVVTPVNNSNVTRYDDYILQLTDANGCINTDTVSVGSYPVPMINFDTPPGQCFSNNVFYFSAGANISTGVNYLWTFSPEANIPTSVQSDISIQYSVAGTFPVILSADYNGCAAQPHIDSVQVYAMPVPNFSATVTNGCEPLIVPFNNLSSGNLNTYTWNFDDGSTENATDPVHEFQQEGTYDISLEAIDTHGCETEIILANYIEVFGTPVGNFVPNPQLANILAPIVQFQNYSTNVLSYTWDFGDNNTSTEWSPSHEYSDTGNYTITLMMVSDHGCVDTIMGSVRVEDNFSFYIPNSFSPNSDGINDAFRGYGIAIKNYTMSIYNRWGEKIFSTDNYDRPWDGRLKSGLIQNDTYVYRIALTDLHDEMHTYFGNVSIVK